MYCLNTRIQILKVWLKSVPPFLKYRIFSSGLFIITLYKYDNFDMAISCHRRMESTWDLLMSHMAARGLSLTRPNLLYLPFNRT